MTAELRDDRAWLLATARDVSKELKLHSDGTRLRIRIPGRTATTNTDGWRAIIGDLGKNQPRLEVWLDRFSGYHERKLYACFCSTARERITSITKRVSRKLWPVRVVKVKDTHQGQYVVLCERLKRSEFNTPILEEYAQGRTFYGIFDPTRESGAGETPHFSSRAVAFFEDVARTLPGATAQDEQREVYSRCENRKLVASHLIRERSRLLAAERKILDDYVCQVCGLRFEDVYGKLGFEFAEAHHLVPLSQLRERVKTRIEDLTTVCANCHRMLHRMAGERDDVKRLRAIARRHRGDSTNFTAKP